MMGKIGYSFEKNTVTDINDKHNHIPFILLTNIGKPFLALAKSKEGFYFSSPYFILKNKLLDGSCLELFVLEPVEADGCLVEYPERFYSLLTTRGCVIVSSESFSGIQTFSSKFVNRELIKPCPKDD